MEGLVLLGGSGATAALKHAGLSGLPLGRVMTKVAAYAATHNVGGWPGTQPGTKRARTDGADGGGTSGDYDKDVKLSEGLAASLGKGKYAKQSDLTRGAMLQYLTQRGEVLFLSVLADGLSVEGLVWLGGSKATAALKQARRNRGVSSSPVWWSLASSFVFVVWFRLSRVRFVLYK